MGLFGFNSRKVTKTAKKVYRVSKKTYKTAKKGNNIFWKEWDSAFNVPKPSRQTKSRAVFHSKNSIWDDDIN